MRAHLRSSLALIILIGLLGGIALGALAGARRTGSAYERFLAASNADTVAMASGGAGVGFNYEVDLRDIVSMPEVERSRIGNVYFMDVRVPSGREVAFGSWALLAGEDTATQAGVNVPQLVEGRLADPDRIDEVEVGFHWAETFGVELGDVLEVDLLPPELLADFNRGSSLAPAARLKMKVVGIVAAPGTFPPKIIFWQVFGTPAFHDRYKDVGANVDGAFVRLVDEGPSLASFKARVDTLAGGAQQFVLQSETTSGVERSTGLIAIALSLFALMVASAMVIFAVQSITRLIAMTATDNLTLGSLGASRSEVFGASVLLASAQALTGILIAVVVALALSALLPFGVARIAEPSPGISFDAFVLLGGGSALAATIIGGSMFPAWLSSGSRRWTEAGRPAGQRHPSRVAAFVTRIGGTPSVVAGTRLALERGRGRTAVPVWTTVVTSAVGTATLVMSLTFSASTARLLDTPRLYGWDFDFVAGNLYGPDLGELARAQLDSNPAVAGYSAGTTNLRMGLIGADGTLHSINVMGLDLVDGVVTPTMIDGRWPNARDEIALGTTSMRQLGVSMGDTVPAVVGEGEDAFQRELTVVGRTVMPSLNDPNLPDLGEGAGMTFAGVRDFIPGAFMNLFPVRYSAEATPEQIDAVQQAFPFTQIGDVRARPSLLDTLEDTGPTPLLIAGILAAMAAATLTHGLVTAIARRRRDLATLKAIGFRRRQIRGAVVWQGAMLTLIAVLLALPAGIIGGRLMWLTFASQVGFVPETVVPLAALAALVPVAVVLGVAVSLVPARNAARTPAAVVLRTE